MKYDELVPLPPPSISNWPFNVDSNKKNTYIDNLNKLAKKIILKDRTGDFEANIEDLLDYQEKPLTNYTCENVVNIGVAMLNPKKIKKIEKYNNIKLIDKFYKIKSAYPK